ncbi:glycosyltransferase [Cytobacillus firmus]|uniref:Glycosyltransferase 2-like domain-containing protein n=1 Tax=Cytobacillus firmus TaxID=1399 RepID=A0A800N9A8_CYTFI|nr:glycosyltransferase [Cytobacillus firmus]KAF0822384.1 hypothetical protein KIS1582_3872 [Cytobacillus firmus]
MEMIEMLTIVLSWNRPNLLEKTIESYFRTVSVPHRLIVVDNASNDETVYCLKKLSKQYNFKAVFLEKNLGGLAFNHILKTVNLEDVKFVHFSENDIEYRKNWDKELLQKFDTFPKVGQLSPYSPFPEVEKGEVWGIKPAQFVQKGAQKIYLSLTNVGTTSIVRKELIKQGLRWENVGDKEFCCPADSKFSKQVRELGYAVAWNDRYLASNLGHNITEFQRELDYYIKNYQSKNKKRNTFNTFQKRLEKQGYNLMKQKDGRYIISKNINDRNN